MAEKFFDLEKVVTKYIDELKKININPEQVFLFGSYARGTADQWSDIDLVIISKDFENIPPLERLEQLSLATLHLNAPIEAIGYTPQEIAERGDESIFWEEIKKNYKILYQAA